MAPALAYVECPLPPCCTLLEVILAALCFNFDMVGKTDCWTLPILNTHYTADSPHGSCYPDAQYLHTVTDFFR